MRIVFVAPVFPPEPEPSAIMASELCREWTRKGHAVTLICPFPNRPAGRTYSGFHRKLWQRSTALPYRVLRVWTWLVGRRRLLVNRLFENISFGISAGIALLVIERPDIVICEAWPLFGQMAVVSICRLRKLACVNYVKDLYPEALLTGGLSTRDGWITKLLSRLDFKVCDTADLNVVISEGMKATLSSTRKVEDEKILVIRDWIDLSYMQPFKGKNPWREENSISDVEMLFMFAGTMGYASGVDILANVAEILRENSGIRIVCVGEGPLKEKLARAKRDKRLDNLTVLDFQPRERVSEMQSAADVMLLITATNTANSSVPCKFITYCAVGKPVLAAADEESDLAQAIIRNDLGRVVSPGNAQRIGMAIAEMAQMSAQELALMGTRARRFASRNYSLERAVSDFDAVFGRLFPDQALLLQTRRSSDSRFADSELHKQRDSMPEPSSTEERE